MESTKLKYLPNTLTFCNMALGILVICIMIYNNSLFITRLGCFLIYIAAILDLLDGYLARHLNVSSEMGKQLDSFADFVTFGIAPIALFISNMPSVTWFIIMILLLYPLAGGYRLARYNIQGHCQYFVGLPITASGFILVTAILISSYIHNIYTERFILVFLLLALVLSILMVSNLQVIRILKINIGEINHEK